MWIRDRNNRSASAFGLRPSAFGLRPIGLALALLSITAGCSDVARTDGTTTSAAGDLLQASPNPIDLGDVAPLSQHKTAVTLRNPGNSPVRVAKIQSSCPCARMQLPEMTIAPGGEVRAEVTVDMSAEPGFVGGLMIVVTGLTADGETAFSVRISLQVAEPPKS